MAQDAILRISIISKGIAQAQIALERLQKSATRTKLAAKNMGTAFKKDAAAGFGKIESAAGKFTTFLSGGGTSAVSKYIGKMSNLFKTLGSVKALMIAMIAIQLVKFFNKAAKAAAEFNEQIANIGSLIPEQITKLRTYEEQISNIAIAYGRTQNDIAEATYQTISAFGDLANTTDIVVQATEAAVAGLSSTKDAVNLLATVSKGYNDTTTETIEHISDLAFTTVRLGQTTFPELANSMGRVVPLANSLGVSMEELFTVGATLTGVTGDTAEVMTQFRSILTAMVKPTTELSKLYEEIGVGSGQEFIAQAGGAFEALQLIKQAAEASGQELAAYLPRVEGLTGALALTGAQAETFEAKFQEMNDTLGATDEALRAQTQGVNRYGFIWKQFTSQIEALKISIGKVVLPFKALIAEGLTPSVLIFKSLFNAIAAFVQLGETITRPFRKLASLNLAAIVKGVETVLNGIAKAFLFVSDIIDEIYYQVNTTVKGAIDSIRETIREFIDSLGITDSAFIRFIQNLEASEIGAAIFNTALKIILSGIDLFITALQEAIFVGQLFIQHIVNIGKILIDVFTGNFENLKESVSETFEDMAESFTKMKGTILIGFSSISSRWEDELDTMEQDTLESTQRMHAYVGNIWTAPEISEDTLSPFRRIEEDLKSQLTLIERNKQLMNGLGMEYDSTAESSEAYNKALEALLADEEIFAVNIQEFIQEWGHLNHVVGETAETFSDLESEFLKQISDIDTLASVYEQLGIEFDANAEKADAFNDILQKMIENENISTEQVLAFADAWGYLGQTIEEINFENTLASMNDFYDVLNEKIFQGLRNVLDITPELAVAITQLGTALTEIAISGAVDGFSALGEAFADGKITADEFKDAIVAQLQTILDALPLLFLQAGLQMLASGDRAGWGLIAASASSAFVSGFTKGATENNAQGNVYENMTPFKEGGAFTNSIVNTPTNFRFAKGTGLMGEAGAEAIVPLTRTQSGDLGVKSVGGGTVVNVNVVNQSSSNVEVTEQDTFSGKDIEVLVKNTVRTGINDGSFDKPLTNRLDTQVRGTA